MIIFVSENCIFFPFKSILKYQILILFYPHVNNISTKISSLTGLNNHNDHRFSTNISSLTGLNKMKNKTTPSRRDAMLVEQTNNQTTPSRRDVISVKQ